jgi:hypothetical protein
VQPTDTLRIWDQGTRTCNQTVMSWKIKAGFVDLFYSRWRLIAFVAFRRGRFRRETGAVRYQAKRTVGSNPSLSASQFARP